MSVTVGSAGRIKASHKLQCFLALATLEFQSQVEPCCFRRPCGIFVSHRPSRTPSSANSTDLGHVQVRAGRATKLCPYSVFGLSSSFGSLPSPTLPLSAFSLICLEPWDFFLSHSSEPGWIPEQVSISWPVLTPLSLVSLESTQVPGRRGLV